MKNWKVVLWLVMFFPVGLYLMFTQTNWRKSIKYVLTGFFVLLLIVGGIELWSNLFFLSSFLVIIYGLFSVFRKSSRRKGIGILVLGALMIAGASPVVSEQAAERERIEQEVLAAQEEAERLAEEERQEEIARQEELERIEEEKRLEKQLKEEIVQAIEKVEEEPTQKNYDVAAELLEELDDDDLELETRLAEAKPAVEEYEEQLAIAQEAVDEAIESKDRPTYDSANELVLALSVSNSSLNSQMRSLDRQISEIEEEERLAAEKAEEERIAQEKAEEEKRLAEAEKKAQEAQANESSQSQSSGGGSGGSGNSGSQSSSQQTPPPASKPKEQPASPPAQADNTTKTVYIAPDSGTKYHFSANCRGLSNANSIQEMSLSQAQSQGYDLCGWEK